MNMNSPTRLVLIGNKSPRPNGASIKVDQFLTYLQNDPEVDLAFINTYRPFDRTSSIFFNVMAGFKVIFSILRQLGTRELVVFLASQPAFVSFGPVLFILSRILKFRIVCVLIGGALDIEHQSFSYFKKYLFKNTVLSADLVLLQTKHLMNYVSSIRKCRVEWLPNFRKMESQDLYRGQRSNVCRRFVYIGRIVEEKGVGVLLEASSFLKDSDVTIDMYGPIDDDYGLTMINQLGCGIVNYRGVLEYQQVLDTLANYDALILPTFYKGEGYPGVVIEAYSQGKPVIVTDWRALPEIVDSDSGIIIPPYSPDQLANAVIQLYSDPLLYRKLCEGAYNKRLNFSEDIWLDQFVRWCHHVVR